MYAVVRGHDPGWRGRRPGRTLLRAFVDDTGLGPGRVFHVCGSVDRRCAVRWDNYVAAKYAGPWYVHASWAGPFGRRLHKERVRRNTDHSVGHAIRSARTTDRRIDGTDQTGRTC